MLAAITLITIHATTVATGTVCCRCRSFSSSILTWDRDWRGIQRVKSSGLLLVVGNKGVDPASTPLSLHPNLIITVPIQFPSLSTSQRIGWGKDGAGVPGSCLEVVWNYDHNIPFIYSEQCSVVRIVAVARAKPGARELACSESQ